jgi:hypothetical protein
MYGYRQAPLPQTPPQTWWPRIIAWCVLGLGLLLVGATGVAGYQSESKGVAMSYVAVGPFVFGAVATLVGHFTRYRKLSSHAGATLGCGCGAALFATFALFLFFAVIWRML